MSKIAMTLGVACVLAGAGTAEAAKLREAGPVLATVRDHLDDMKWENESDRTDARTALLNHVESGLTALHQLVDRIAAAPELSTRSMGVTVQRERQELLDKIVALRTKATRTRALPTAPICCAWRDAIADMKRQAAGLATELTELRAAITARRDEIRRRADRADDEIAAKARDLSTRKSAIATLKRETDQNEQQLLTLQNQLEAAAGRKDHHAIDELKRQIDALVATINRQRTEWDRACTDYDTALTHLEEALDDAAAYPGAQRLWEAELT